MFLYQEERNKNEKSLIPEFMKLFITCNLLLILFQILTIGGIIERSFFLNLP